MTSSGENAAHRRAGSARVRLARALVVVALLVQGCSVAEPLAGVRPDSTQSGDGGSRGLGGGGIGGSGTGGVASSADPCLGVTCDTPPSNACQSASELTAYDKVGTCSAGKCSYTSQSITCPCQADACTTDPCLAVTCNSPPAASCSDPNTLTSYASAGTCDGGGCGYTATLTPCASGCANGACNSGTGGQPHCAGLAATCGPSGDDDCCASSVVPGGMFYRSYDEVTPLYDQSKAYPATVSDFRLDTYEITVSRFRGFVAAYSQTMIAPGAGVNPNNPYDTGWDAKTWNASLDVDASALKTALASCAPYSTWTDNAGTSAAESLPINCLTWFEAQAFCIWDGGRLPTEAEWNYAASGGAEQRAYPWGNTTPVPDQNQAVYGCFRNSVGTCSGVTNIAPVGSDPAGNGKWGQADLAGNVWEWAQDWYSFEYTATDSACDNCAATTRSDTRVVRGGSFLVDSSYMFCADRYDLRPEVHNSSSGARCARAP